jgi:hypothetical protein
VSFVFCPQSLQRNDEGCAIVREEYYTDLLLLGSGKTSTIRNSQLVMVLAVSNRHRDMGIIISMAFGGRDRKADYIISHHPGDDEKWEAFI